ncbi:helix-turn-helix transcriptional regulator [Dactylosporangium sp. CS-047395]|uniref:helix-turn-helix transcriptional regulator n=1 Tax=Dactylosporangium sp. CS-047395 TaxID=3239936 RepID=UPI003D8E9B56
MDSPTSRALLTLEMVQNTPGITAERLGERLGVSERAARRYVGMLREAGIPVESERGPYGGYRVGRGLRPAPLLFTATEALGLVMAVLGGQRDAAADGALGKLLRALPEPVAAPATSVLQSAATRPGPPDRADPHLTATLVRACADRRRVRIAYRSGSGSAFETDVDPWSVVVRHSRWYLLCLAHHARARRAYRVDRIGTVTVLDTPFTPPDDLDPVTALEEQLATGWEFAVEVLVDAPRADVEARMPRSLGRLEAAGGERCRLLATTDNPLWYVQQLAAFPVPIHIVGGPELREAAAIVGNRLTAAVAWT